MFWSEIIVISCDFDAFKHTMIFSFTVLGFEQERKDAGRESLSLTWAYMLILDSL